MAHPTLVEPFPSGRPWSVSRGNFILARCTTPGSGARSATLHTARNARTHEARLPQCNNAWHPHAAAVRGIRLKDGKPLCKFVCDK
mmetsp:Transcript_105783/g.309442  ORF Transcript_105783/g.309442 Transcript_105783/m.309442 type:complete len:86 (+) Transcript_105783:274-531(+)